MIQHKLPFRIGTAKLNDMGFTVRVPIRLSCGAHKCVPGLGNTVHCKRVLEINKLYKVINDCSVPPGVSRSFLVICEISYLVENAIINYANF